MSITVNGKDFEEQFKRQWKKSFPDGDIVRFHDIQYGYKNISGLCDFACYNFPLLFYIDCKAHKGASIPFSAIPQYDKLIEKAGIKGIRAGIVLYLYEKEKIFYVPISTIKQLMDEGKKSVGIKAFEEGYRIIEIPSKKLRVFMDSDYTVLMNTEEGE